MLGCRLQNGPTLGAWELRHIPGAAQRGAHLLTILMLVMAALLAGALNAVAGGGTFLTLPALLYAGVPPVAANATSTVALLPGYLSGAYGFRHSVGPAAGLSVTRQLVTSLCGGLVGALLLLITPNEIFRAVVPWLLLLATALFAVGDRLAVWLQKHARAGTGSVVAGLFVVSVYGGYFNGGLGILLLAMFCLVGMTDLNTMNGLKNLISAVLTAISVVIFSAAGLVHWPQALVMMVAGTVGGYLGALVARHIRPSHLRSGIVVVGLVMAILFFAA